MERLSIVMTVTICQSVRSYGEVFFSCLAGSWSGVRCTHGEKMQIRILNDMNPNAIYRPAKPTAGQITDYVEG